MGFMGMCKMYPNSLPSDIMGIRDDDYTSYCFNEAMAFIRMKLDLGEEIVSKHIYNTPSQLYKKYT